MTFGKKLVTKIALVNQELVKFIIQLCALCTDGFAMTLFPRNDLYTIRVDEIKIMYTMLSKTRISPVIGMIDYWLGTFQRDEYVECTSLITRLARNLGLLDRAIINYIPTYRITLDYEHFFQAHMLKID